MAIVYPSDAIARRWGEGHRARLRRAPLEEFLRRGALVPAPAGVAQDSDNLVRATEMMVERGVSRYREDSVEELNYMQRSIVGRVACVVSSTLAELISQPEAWRIAALVSIARLLTPWIGLNAAAMESAATVREFQRQAVQPQQDQRIIDETRSAVNRTHSEDILTGTIAARLGSCACEDASTLRNNLWHG